MTDKDEIKKILEQFENWDQYQYNGHFCQSTKWKNGQYNGRGGKQGYDIPYKVLDDGVIEYLERNRFKLHLSLYKDQHDCYKLRLEKRHNRMYKEFVYFPQKIQETPHLKYLIEIGLLWNNSRRPVPKTLFTSNITSFPKNVMNAYKFKHGDKILTYSEKC